MREMKDSGVKWVGEIPSSWKVYKVKVNKLLTAIMMFFQKIMKKSKKLIT